MLRQLQAIDKIISVLLPIGKIMSSKIKTGTLITVSEDFSNLSGIWNGQLLNKHEGADKLCLQLDQKIHGDVKILY